MAKDKDNSVVYHYCGVEAFLNIIQSSRLWLSDIRKSNDSKEETWIRDKINDEIERRLAETDPTALKAWEKGYQLNAPSSRTVYVTTVYVSCFSERKDCLSQWRGYAQDGQGIAIGFSKKYLQGLKSPHSLLFNRIIYKDKEQNKFVNAIVDENFEKMPQKGVGHVALELNINYLLKFPLYKNPSFEEEKEWRIIMLSSPNHQGISHCRDFSFLTPQYRVNNGKIISYLEMDFSKIKGDLIKEIWIGPKSKITQNDIIKLLVAKDYYGDTLYNENEPILIEYSKSSYQ